RAERGHFQDRALRDERCMMFVSLFYFVMIFFSLYYFVRLFYGSNKSMKITLYITTLAFCLALAMFVGLLWSALYKPHAYWQAYDLTFNSDNPGWLQAFLNSVNGDGDAWKVYLVAPYVALAEVFRMWFLVWWHHWTVAIVITHVLAIYTWDKITI